MSNTLLKNLSSNNEDEIDELKTLSQQACSHSEGFYLGTTTNKFSNKRPTSSDHNMNNNNNFYLSVSPDNLAISSTGMSYLNTFNFTLSNFDSNMAGLEYGFLGDMVLQQPAQQVDTFLPSWNNSSIATTITSASAIHSDHIPSKTIPTMPTISSTPNEAITSFTTQHPLEEPTRRSSFTSKVTEPVIRKPSYSTSIEFSPRHPHPRQHKQETVQLSSSSSSLTRLKNTVQQQKQQQRQSQQKQRQHVSINSHDINRVSSSIDEKPFNYAEGFHYLIQYVREKMDRDDLMRISKALANFRPSFLALIMNLTEEDLIFTEKCIQRTLLEYEKLISFSGTPTVVWRRTGEICLLGKEFCLLTQWTKESLLDKKTYIYELMDCPSAVEYWKLFSKHAFDNTDSSSARYTCVLQSPEKRPIPCTFCFMIKRDIFDLPSVIVGNFLPILS